MVMPMSAVTVSQWNILILLSSRWLIVSRLVRVGLRWPAERRNLRFMVLFRDGYAGAGGG